MRLYRLLGGIAETTPEPTLTQAPTVPTRQFDMNDPNVQAFPIFATARTAEELRVGDRGWQSAAEIKVDMHDTHPDRLVDGMTVYEWRFRPIFAWVDNYLATNRITIANMTDYEKTVVIRQIIEEELLEEFIGLWQPGFRHHSRDCVPRAHAIRFMMIAMDFELIKTIGITDTAGASSHSANAYWDSAIGAARFVDANLSLNIWNIFVDELVSRNFIIDQ
jgi:hypothetical protein